MNISRKSSKNKEICYTSDSLELKYSPRRTAIKYKIELSFAGGSCARNGQFFTKIVDFHAIFAPQTGIAA